MKTLTTFLVLLTAALAAPTARATVLTSIPSPMAQGGMIMPTIMVSDSTSTLSIIPAMDQSVPLLASLDHWRMGDTFDPSATWYGKLDPTQGNALFSSRYGFTVDGDPLPTGPSALGIRLVSADAGLQFWNYTDIASGNRFDEVFTASRPLVLWNGGMWHDVVTLSNGSSPGTYSAVLEFFVADKNFTSGTGPVDYSPNALTAGAYAGYTSTTVNLTWTAVPEPSTLALFGLAWAGLTAFSSRARKSCMIE